MVRSEPGLQNNQPGKNCEQNGHRQNQKDQWAGTRTMMQHMRAGIYARISEDAGGKALGVGRQKQDCEKVAREKGWDVVAYYIDNDVSATRSKRRPEYERMLADIALRKIDAIVIYSIDRLTRRPVELEAIIALADIYFFEMATVSGGIHIATTEDRMLARTMGALASYETSKMSQRLKRKFLEKAQNGEPHGFSPYGYTRVKPVDANGITDKIGQDIIHQEHGEVVREAARRTLKGESLRSIVTDFNLRNIHGPQAVKWNSTILRQILLRPTNAGLRQYQGKVLGPSTTEPLYDTGTHDRLVALLKDPSRRSNFSGSSYKYLLSGLAICGLCGGPMRRQIGREETSKRTGATKRQPPSYNCSVCFKVRRHQEAVDELIVELIIGRLSMPDAATFHQTGDSVLADEAQVTIEAINAKLALAVDQYADDDLDAEQFKRLNEKLRRRRLDAERDLDGARPRTLLSSLTDGGAVRENWGALPIDAQRDVVTDLITVTILPAGSGKRFDPDLIEVKWKD
ncbi:recombinase family protein [Cryobacterium sp. TMT1-66-1]|uniref:recombinase family protein n=1 Tax=Cryobacterium sp. TMT1-66-1 TaxID=1259242 RepID=UPI00106BD769|nr:recombinase family protein [Cryobacterium sp. TMT1-66-1]TFD04170.1 recombinase family protein [Cryobacterium sp. TMT1-66-1]